MMSFSKRKWQLFQWANCAFILQETLQNGWWGRQTLIWPFFRLASVCNQVVDPQMVDFIGFSVPKKNCCDTCSTPLFGGGGKYVILWMEGAGAGWWGVARRAEGGAVGVSNPKHIIQTPIISDLRTLDDLTWVQSLRKNSVRSLCPIIF